MAQQKAQSSLTIIDTKDIDRIENYYLITSQNSAVQPTNGEWGDWFPNIQVPTADAPYLWNYERIIGVGEVIISETEPHIISTYVTNGINGEPGIPGRGIIEIQDYYLVTDDININTIFTYEVTTDTTVQSGTVYYIKNNNTYTIVENPSGNPETQRWYIQTRQWDTNIGIINSEQKYLWNYEYIRYTDGYEEYMGPRLLGVYGDKGNKGDKGDDGVSSYITIRYNSIASYENSTLLPDANTVYIGICIGQESNPDGDSNWQWSKYIGDDGAAVSKIVNLYYLKTDNNPIVPLTNGSSNGITNVSIENQWTTVIPNYSNSGIYYTCVQTSLVNGPLSPIYGDIIEDPSLTESKQDINNLKAKTVYLIEHPTGEDPGIIFSSKATSGTDYGYNAIARPSDFTLRHNTLDLAKFSKDGLVFYKPDNNTDRTALVTINSQGLTINDINGNPVAVYGETATLGNPQGARINISATDGIEFYTSGGDPAAVLTSDALEIANTLTFDQMKIGRVKDNNNNISCWTWDFDENDYSIILKWTGEI